jgi:hypothetical protein
MGRGGAIAIAVRFRAGEGEFGGAAFVLARAILRGRTAVTEIGFVAIGGDEIRADLGRRTTHSVRARRRLGQHEADQGEENEK